MDLKVIEQKQMVERYMLGRLPPPEARFFEQLVRRSPELAERMGLPDALKRIMQLLDDTGTEWRERPPRFWHNPLVPAGLAAATLVALLCALLAWNGSQHAQERFRSAKQLAEQGLMLAPTRAQVLRLPVARPGMAVQTYSIGTRVGPTLAELHLDVGYASGNLYSLTIKREDGTYWGRLDNLLRDSSGDLRVTLNSGIFATGTYLLDIDSINLRGEGHEAGHLKVRVDAS
jgi:hypothetical protein